MTMAAKACILHCVNHEDSEYGCKIEPYKQYKGRITGKPENCPYFKEKKRVHPSLQKEMAMVYIKESEIGRQFAPKISYAVAKNIERGMWIGSISIGEEYYETDPYKTKEGAVSELLGCIEELKEKTEQIINELNDIVY